MGVFVVVIALAAAAPTSDSAPTWHFHRQAQADAEPCDPAGPDAAAAKPELAAIDSAIRAATSSTPLGTLRKRIEELTKNRCFALLGATPSRAPATTVELTWWWDHGGRGWLESFLERGPAARTWSRYWALPPDVRPVLPADLAPFACPDTDDACGADGRGWERRAEDWFRLRRRTTELEASARSSIDACAAGLDSENGFPSWLACIESHASTAVSHPLGRLATPRKGWLFVTGRRGHYGYCDEIRAYALETGDSWVASSCSRLACGEDVAVDQTAPSERRRLGTRQGHVPVAAIRETLWALLLAPATKFRRVGGLVAIPEGLRLHGTAKSASSSATFSVSSGQTTLEWRWVDGERTLRAGELRWPDSSEDGDAYAALLLAAADESFLEGCGATRPPLARVDQPSVNHRDADPSTLPDVYAQLSAALEAAVPTPCRPEK